jgi:hypothetical protein
MRKTNCAWLVALIGGVLAVPFCIEAQCKIDLQQGWTDDIRVRFWYTSQGSRLMAYDAFVALEQAGSTAPFSLKLEDLKYIPNAAAVRELKSVQATVALKDLNPNRLPIGFAKDKRDGGFVGLTCAACHTSLIKFDRDNTCIVDGGPARADFIGLLLSLDEAIKDTLADNAKFNRTKKNAGDVPEGILRAALVHTRDDIESRMNRSNNHTAGDFGRVDAFGHIFNKLMTPNDKSLLPARAPVSYPHLWDTATLDRVQWNGANDNRSPLGPLRRNVGEVLGVFAELDIKSPSDITHFGYKSSLDLGGLIQLESWVSGLKSPRWPYALPTFAAPAEGSATFERGRQLYKNNCQSCHKLWTDDSGDEVTLIPLGDETSVRTGAVIGVDALMAKQFADRAKAPSKYTDPAGPYPPFSFDLLRPGIRRIFVPLDTGLLILSDAVGSTILGLQKLSLSDLTQSALNFVEDLIHSQPRYRARPLNGIWATAPYLHNGSVATLDELLTPETKRRSSFPIGCLEYDAGPAGFKCENSGNFNVGRKDLGNSNLGHNWGTTLSPADKLALIAYLKSL